MSSCSKQGLGNHTVSQDGGEERGKGSQSIGTAKCGAICLFSGPGTSSGSGFSFSSFYWFTWQLDLLGEDQRQVLRVRSRISFCVVVFFRS